MIDMGNPYGTLIQFLLNSDDLKRKQYQLSLKMAEDLVSQDRTSMI